MKIFCVENQVISRRVEIVDNSFLKVVIVFIESTGRFIGLGAGGFDNQPAAVQGYNLLLNKSQ